jgi:hypothetical protein
MNKRRFGWAAGLGIVMLLAGSSAWANKSSPGPGRFINWTCEIDLAAAKAPIPTGEPSSLFTNKTMKVCTARGRKQNILISCQAKVANWKKGVQLRSGFPCQISRSQCGGTGFVTTTRSSLTISPKGDATLICRYE